MVDAAPAAAPVADTRDASSRAGYLGRVVRPVAVKVALGWLVLLAFASLAAAWIMPHDPIAQDLSRSFVLPSPDAWLGTDQLGRDILSRLIYGTRETMLGAVVTVLVALAVGLPLGAVAGYAGGWFKVLVGRFADLLLTIPAIIVLLAVLTVFGNSIYAAMASLGVLMSAGIMRLASASAAGLSRELFVDAARVSGVGRVRILVRHVLPNLIGPIIVQTTIIASLGLLLQASLGFLGLGTRPPYPTWGQMVAEASLQIYSHPWLMVPSGVILMLTILAFNTIGDAARDALFGGQIGTGAFRPAKGAVRPPATSSVVDATASAPTADEPTAAEPLLSIRGLRVSYPVRSGAIEVVKGVDLDVPRGTVVGLVGESGSGKTVTALSVLGLVPQPGFVSGGSIRFGGLELAGADARTFSKVRGRRISLISQEPMVALDPCYRVSTHLREVLQGRRGMTRKQADARAIELLETVEMRDPRAVFNAFPHELSGGMAQRVAIAWALAGQPELLIADEPTTALDVTVQAEVLEVLRKLTTEFDMSILLLTHDLGVVADLCDQVAVMQHGRLVEFADTETLFAAPTHEYTRSLLHHVTVLHGEPERSGIPGGDR